RLQSALIDREDKQTEHFALSFTTEIPSALLGTQFEAMHCANQFRRFASTNEEDAKAYARRAAEILRILGRETEGRRLLAQAEAGPLEKPKPDAKHFVIPLKVAANPFEINPSNEIVSFEEARALLEEPKRVNRLLREALPQETEGRPVVELAI